MKTLTTAVLAMIGAGTLALSSAPAAFAVTPDGALQACDDHKEAGKPVPADAKTVTLKVGGMTCGGCADTVRNALLKVDGVYDATVDWQTGAVSVKVDGAKVDEAKLGDAVVKAGYTVDKTKS